MSVVDSEASFAARCSEVCGDSNLHAKLIAADIKTYSNLAFSCGTPRVQPNEAEFKAFADEICGGEASIGMVSKLRRLHFEASTLVVAQLRTMVEGDAPDAPRKLPGAEKASRLQQVKKLLPGIVIEGELEPSHALIDLVAHMGECNSIVWLPPSKCTKRDSELRLGFRDKPRFLTVQEQGVALAPAPDKVEAAHATALEVQWCLQRRGIAFVMCGFLKHETHEKWISQILRAISSEAPPGYANVTLQQALRADSEMFLLLSKEVSRVKPHGAGIMEMDVKMQALRLDPRVTTFLLPLQKPNALPVHPPPDPESAVGARLTKRLKKKDHRLTAPVKADNMPDELKGCPHQTDSSGRRFCWPFNLSKGCNAKCEGSPPACAKGVHGCMTCGRIGHGHSACWYAGGKGRGKGRGKGKGKGKPEAQAGE